MASPGTLTRPELDAATDLNRGGWIVIVFNNEVNTWEEVVSILMLATKCSLDEAEMETWEIDVPVAATRPDSHSVVTQNFVNAILKNEPLIASGEEGIKGLEIGNAMLMAGATRMPVALPMNADAFDVLLKDLEKKYGGMKKLEAPVDAVVDMNASFKK